MKLKEKTAKKKRAPGAGRKHVEDKVKMIPIYMRQSAILKLGGEKSIQNIVNSYIESVIRL